MQIILCHLNYKDVHRPQVIRPHISLIGPPGCSLARGCYRNNRKEIIREEKKKKKHGGQKQES